MADENPVQAARDFLLDQNAPVETSRGGKRLVVYIRDTTKEQVLRYVQDSSVCEAVHLPNASPESET